MKTILLSIAVFAVFYAIARIVRLQRTKAIVRALRAEREVLKVFNSLWDGKPQSKVYTWRKTLHILQADHLLLSESNSKKKVQIAKRKLAESERENPVYAPSGRTKRTIVFETR